MSRRRNRKRRKARKERAEENTKAVTEWIESTPGRFPRTFVGKERSGDAAELRLKFGDTPLAYDEDGKVKL